MLNYNSVQCNAIITRDIQHKYSALMYGNMNTIYNQKLYRKYCSPTLKNGI